nr:hypothetical protein [Tanacetum cinerariifolium]
KIYKPTNNNLRTSSNTSRANQDNSPRIKRNAGYESQMSGNVAGARETVGSLMVQKSRIQCYNCKEFGHVAREYDTDDESDDQELEAHYMHMAKIQEASPDAVDSGPIFDTEPEQKLVEIVLFIFDYGCSKHMTGNLKLLINFVEKFLGTVKFGNDQITPILGYGDLVQGTITIKRVYYVKGLNHNLFSVGQFYDADLEVAFRKSTCFIRDLKGNDLLTGLQAQIGVVRTDKGMEFLNQTLHAYFAAEEIQNQTSIARTPEQNVVVERRNHTLIEAARTMLSAAKVPLFFWAEAIATACFTQNRSLVIPRHEKTPYHMINDRKPSVKFFYIFGSVCYIVRDGENLDKMKEKGDECIFVGYSNQLKAYRVFNRRTRVIMESIYVNFIELPQMASDQNSSDPAPEYRTITTSNELDILFSPMFDEFLNGTSKVVSKSSAVSAADAPIILNNT